MAIIDFADHYRRAELERLKWRATIESLELGGGGPHDPGMEARVAKLEATADHIQSSLVDIRTDLRDLRKNAQADFRLLFGGLITATLGLAGLMAKGFGWL